MDDTMLMASRLTHRLFRLPPTLRVALALLIAAIGIAHRLLMDPVSGVQLPYLALFPAVVVRAWVGGLWSGVTTTLASAAATLAGVGILAVDDDPDGLDLMVLVLTARGAVVRIAPSVPTAMEALRAGEPDLLIADIGMPGQDGYELMRQVRARELQQGRPRLPAIALTAYTSRTHRDRAIAAGFDAHLAKPVDPELLVRMAARLTSGAGI